MIIMHNLESVHQNETHKLLSDFRIKTDNLITARGPDLERVNNNKKNCQIEDFTVPSDHRVKLKEIEKRNKYLYLARELKKLCNMRVTLKPIAIGVFHTVTKGLLKGQEDLEIRGPVKTIQTRALLRSARILGRVLET